MQVLAFPGPGEGWPFFLALAGLVLIVGTGLWLWFRRYRQGED
ncbi:hypothetical protein Afil01_24760 [Actinorhabdospora filicis]|uniref:LPXTG cell wall anchor domain-containing protein n=1 Tax=Actinorhabdospora filicis TaxID=1785913 RepID=A0A9W6SIF2_9ACTN|nr:LPXTG cell wall anchor domain-containing protein [Actinorhabdospora filicis]GLZ77669.1 hypothetical protein Afil01_24760 [Actinorhabdospora filicis]